MMMLTKATADRMNITNRLDPEQRMKVPNIISSAQTNA